MNAKLKQFALPAALLVLFAVTLEMSGISGIFQRITRPFTSSTMRVVPDGSGGQAKNFPEGAQKATIAAGCFWGPEHMYNHHFPKDALLDTRVGYIGGDTSNPGYRAVCSGRTGRKFPSSIMF